MTYWLRPIGLAFAPLMTYWLRPTGLAFAPLMTYWLRPFSMLRAGLAFAPLMPKLYDLFDAAAFFSRSDDRFRDCRAMNHLFGGNQVRLTALGCFCPTFDGGARTIEGWCRPCFSFAFDRHEFAACEKSRAPFLGRGTGHVGQSIEPDKALRAEDLEAESGAGRGERTEVSGHSLFELEDHRCRVVRIHLDYSTEANTVDCFDFAEIIDHAVDRVQSERGQAAARRFIPIGAPGAGLQVKGIGEGHCRFHVQDRTE